MTAPDDAWRPLAESTRRALAELGYRIGPECLPHEPEPCGSGYAQHTAAHLAALVAVVDHHLGHLKAPKALISGAYFAAAEECDRTCEQPPCHIPGHRFTWAIGECKT